MLSVRRGFHNIKKSFGLIVASIGVGVILAVIVPIWGWIIAAGIALIYCGWYIMEHHCH